MRVGTGTAEHLCPRPWARAPFPTVWPQAAPSTLLYAVGLTLGMCSSVLRAYTRVSEVVKCTQGFLLRALFPLETRVGTRDSTFAPRRKVPAIGQVFALCLVVSTDVAASWLDLSFQAGPVKRAWPSAVATPRQRRSHLRGQVSELQARLGRTVNVCVGAQRQNTGRLLSRGSLNPSTVFGESCPSTRQPILCLSTRKSLTSGSCFDDKIKGI